MGLEKEFHEHYARLREGCSMVIATELMWKDMDTLLSHEVKKKWRQPINWKEMKNNAHSKSAH